MVNIRVIVATHKEYVFPRDNCYVPIQVGKDLNNKLNIQGDNSGDNISSKNRTFCELTALYWAWKNHFFLDCTYVGLVHYRRYFAGREIILKDKRIASERELLTLLKSCDCIVPKKRNYCIESVYEHYKNAHYIKDLDLVRDIIGKYYPDYLYSFDSVMNGKKLSLFNMFIMKRDLFYHYCEWVFDILFKLESRIELCNYTDYQKRVFGFIAERLFNVYLLKNCILIKEVGLVYLEKENIIEKAFSLLVRKFLKKGRR